MVDFEHARALLRMAHKDFDALTRSTEIENVRILLEAVESAVAQNTA